MRSRVKEHEERKYKGGAGEYENDENDENE
jgi:hypothetical protein